MNLKESYRYMNYLDKLLDATQSYITLKDFITSTKQEHYRKKSNPDAIDETIEVKKSQEVNFTPKQILDFAVKVLKQKDLLSLAISNAKKNTKIDIDHSVAINKKKQEFVSKLNYMASIKNSEKKSRGTDYKFNQEGNQITYYYEISEITTIDYNRDDVKGLIKKYNKECDEVSAELDKIQIETEVNYVPLWDVNDSLEDVILV